MSTDTTTQGASSTRVRRLLLLGVLCLLGISVGMLVVLPLAHEVMRQVTEWLHKSGADETSLERLDQYGRVPDFTLIEHSGRSVTLAELIGKVWVADFIYTECPDTCPQQSANMARLQDDFVGEPAVRFVSISVDPEHDTPEVLSEYAGRFQADPQRWLFLTGSKEAIYRLVSAGFHLGVVDRGENAEREIGEGQAWLGPMSAWAHPVPNAERQPVLHSSRFVLVDRRAQIRGYYDGTDWKSLEHLRENVRMVLQEKAPER
jgi:protein SCO1/2